MSRALLALVLVLLVAGCATTGANGPPPAQPQTALDAQTGGANGK